MPPQIRFWLLPRSHFKERWKPKFDVLKCLETFEKSNKYNDGNPSLMYRSRTRHLKTHSGEKSNKCNQRKVKQKGKNSNLSLMYWSRASDPRAADCSHVVILVTFNTFIIICIIIFIITDRPPTHRPIYLRLTFSFQRAPTLSSLNSSIMPRTPARKKTWQLKFYQLIPVVSRLRLSIFGFAKLEI